MSTTVGYRYLYDPDYAPDKNGRYYDDMPPCSHGHQHHVHDAGCKHHHGDNNDDHSRTPILDHTTDKESEEDDEEVPDLIDIRPFKYTPGENSPEFPKYPEFEPNQGVLPEENIEDTKSSFRKSLEVIWDDCWEKITAILLYCKPMAAPLIKFYHKVYIPYVLVNILNLCGGPEHAGRIGRYARISQFLGASLTWGALIALIVIVGFTSVWTLGLAAPLWALILGFSGVGINMAGSMVAAAANHGKIEPFYREEIKLHDENNALRRELSIPEMGLEHGFLHSSKKRQNVHMHRYEHDAHTWVVGSGSSITASILEFASIAAGLGGIFLMISRFSSVISLFGASYVNQDRLSLFKEVISKKINSHYELKCKLDSKKHKAIYSILSEKLNQLNINKNHYYSRWVKFYCYRAIDAAYDNAAQTNDSLKQINLALDSTIGHHLKDERGFLKNNKNPKKCFSRSYLRGLVKADGLSVLESLPVLESAVRDALEICKNEAYTKIATAVNDFSAANLHSEDATTLLFLRHLKFALMEHFKKGFIQKITKEKLEQALKENSEFFYTTPDGNNILNKENLSLAFPLKGPHGAQITPDYHAKKLVERIILPTLMNQEGVGTVNQTLRDFYESDMDQLDASSSLFILHLKCALIEHSIKAMTKEEIVGAVELGKDLFYKNNNRYKLNKEKIARKYKIDDQHGGLTEPDDPARELVYRMIIPYLKQKLALKDAIFSRDHLDRCADPSLVFKCKFN